MGVARAHLCVAEAIGYDNFITMWRIYDEEPSYRSMSGMLEIPMRAFRSYLRFQRNRIIESLSNEGCTVRDIQQRLQGLFRESITRHHIRAIRRGRYGKR